MLIAEFEIRSFPNQNSYPSQFLTAIGRERVRVRVSGIYGESVVEELLELEALVDVGAVVVEAGRLDDVVSQVEAVEVAVESAHEEIVRERDERGGLDAEDVGEQLRLVDLVSDGAVLVVVVGHDRVVGSLDVEVQEVFVRVERLRKIR